MQTVSQWINQLPDYYRQRAKKYIMPATANKPVESMMIALGCLKWWGYTEEGCRFWLKVDKHYKFGTPLKVLKSKPLN